MTKTDIFFLLNEAINALEPLVYALEEKADTWEAGDLGTNNEEKLLETLAELCQHVVDLNEEYEF